MKLLSRLAKFVKPRPLDPERDLPNKQAMAVIHKQISTAVTQAYHNPTLHQLYKSVPQRFLLDTAINFYVGSRSCPRNPVVVELLFKEAAERSSTNLERLDIHYYRNYLRRLEAIGQGSAEDFDEATEAIYNLAEDEHPNALFMLGKEMYKVAHNMLDRKQKKDRLDMIARATEVLNKSIELGCYSALYTLGLMFQEGDIGNKRDYQTAFNYFLMSASFDNPYAYFKLSQYYKQGRSIPKNLNLYYRYLKKSAQMGVIQSQHNLAMQYLTGTLIKKNQLKALAWFLHAGELGFAHSNYNAAMMLLSGSEDGKIKPNIKAALVKLEEVHKHGEIDVRELINKLSKVLEEQEQKVVKVSESQSKPVK